jgi:hypothetical protein
MTTPIPVADWYALTTHADHFRELFLGPPGQESDEARNARLAAGRDVLTDLLHAGRSDQVAREDALYALRLEAVARTRSALRRRPRQQRPSAAQWLERAA